MTAKQRLHRALLDLYRRLPERWQLRIVHLVAPTHSVGALALIRADDGALLLVRHTYKEGWGVPGGLVKAGEHPADAVVREAREEVGLTIEVTGEPAVVVDPPTRRVDVIYPSRVAAGASSDARPNSVEIAEAVWHAAGQLPRLQPEAAGAIAALARREAQAGSGGAV